MEPIRKYSGLVLLFLLCGNHSPVSAGIRPSFGIEVCSWNATHIVVATEGKTIDGVFRVLESWRGDLNPGDTIKIPELASFKPRSSRAVSEPWAEPVNESGYVGGRVEESCAGDKGHRGLVSSNSCHRRPRQ